jgi:hypothetical protein
MDPVSQIFLQARAPTGSWDLPAQMFIQGRQLNQRQQQIDLQREEQDALLPLRQESQRLANTSLGLDILNKRSQLERDNQVKAGMGEALQLMLDAGANPQGYLASSINDRIRQLAITNPAVLTSPQGQALLNNWRGAHIAAKALDQFGQPSKVTVDSEGKTTTTFGEESRRGTPLLQLQDERQKLLDSGVSEDDPRISELDTGIKYLTTKTFDPLAKEKLDLRKRALDQADIRTQLNALGLELRATDQGFKIENLPMPSQTPGQPVETVRPHLVPQARPQTTANVTKLQDALTTSTTALRQISKLQPMVNAKTFGPLAYIERQLIDKGLANIPGFENLVNEDRVEAGVIASGLRAATLRALRSDSNITDAERKIIEQDLPSPNKFLASPREAMIQLRAINQGIVERSIQAAHTLNQTIPDNFLRDIPDDLLTDLIRSRQLTPEEAERWYKLKP